MEQRFVYHPQGIEGYLQIFEAAKKNKERHAIHLLTKIEQITKYYKTIERKNDSKRER